MTSPMNSTFYLASSAPGSNTSLPFVRVTHADTLLILPPIVIPTPQFHLFPCVSSVSPISSALDTDPLSPSSTVSLPSQDTAPHAPPDDLHLPIALCKETRLCTRHLISHYVSYDRLSPSFCALALSVASESIPQFHVEAVLTCNLYIIYMIINTN